MIGKDMKAKEVMSTKKWENEYKDHSLSNINTELSQVQDMYYYWSERKLLYPNNYKDIKNCYEALKKIQKNMLCKGGDKQ